MQSVHGVIVPDWLSDEEAGQADHDPLHADHIVRTEAITNESIHKGVNKRRKYVTHVRLQRPESPTVTRTWLVCKYKVDKLHRKYILSQCFILCLFTAK